MRKSFAREYDDDTLTALGKAETAKIKNIRRTPVSDGLQTALKRRKVPLEFAPDHLREVLHHENLLRHLMLAQVDLSETYLRNPCLLGYPDMRRI